MKKVLITIVHVALLSVLVHAQVFKVNALYYTVTDAVEKEVQIVPENYPTPSYAPQNVPTGDIIIPATVINPNDSETYTVTKISKSCFAYNNSITSVTIPNTVEIIDSLAFRECKFIETLTFAENSSLVRINNAAFSYNWALTELNLPEGLEVVEDWAFLECKNVTKVTLPSTINTLYEMSFRDLTAIKDFYILAQTPPSFVGVAPWAFYNTAGNATLWIPKGKSATYTGDPWGTFKAKKEILPLDEQVVKVGNLFYKIIDLEAKKVMVVPENYPTLSYITPPTGSIVIPSSITHPGDNETYSVTKIGKNCFIYNNSITGITIPNTVEVIDTFSFNECKSLETLTFEENSSLKRINRSAFAYNWALEELNLPEGLEVVEDWVFLDCKSVTKITLPSTITTLYEMSFRDLNAIQDIYCLAPIPPSFIGVPPWAFYNTADKATLWIPQGKSATYTGDPWGTFKAKKEIVPLEDQVVQVGNLFYKIIDLEAKKVMVVPENYPTLNYTTKPTGNIVIPSSITHPGDNETYSVTKIGRSCFYYNNDITAVTIPNTVELIDSTAFNQCKSMATLTFAENSSLQRINRDAFAYCWGLTELNLPEGLQVVEDWVFLDCKNVTKVTLPSTVTSLYAYSFRDMTSLDDVYCLASNPPTVNVGGTFYGTPITDINLWVPAGKISNYNTIVPWSNFKTIQTIILSNNALPANNVTYNIVRIVFGIDIQMNDAGKDIHIMDVNGRTIYNVKSNNGSNYVNLNKGVYLIRIEDKVTKIVV
ncbi:hypothetical protein MASR2M117_22180 [Paludibacter sp.]